MKVLLAALFILGALAAVLCGWGLSGWQAVRTEQAMVRAKAHDAAVDRARIGAEAASRIAERLRADESMRPYFHYQNLFHDPRGSDVDAVAPSPLADGPADPLVAGHFQIRRDLDGALDVTVPTINDVLPELSAPDRLTADTTRRAALRLLAPQLVAAAPSSVPTSTSTQVATTTKPGPRVSAEVARIDPPADTGNLPGVVPRPDEQQPIMQVPLQFELSENQYLQNVAPEQVYSQTRDVAPNAALAQQAEYVQAAQARVAKGTPAPVPVVRRRTTTTSTSTTTAPRRTRARSSARRTRWPPSRAPTAATSTAAPTSMPSGASCSRCSRASCPSRARRPSRCSTSTFTRRRGGPRRCAAAWRFRAPSTSLCSSSSPKTASGAPPTRGP